MSGKIIDSLKAIWRGGDNWNYYWFDRCGKIELELEKALGCARWDANENTAHAAGRLQENLRIRTVERDVARKLAEEWRNKCVASGSPLISKGKQYPLPWEVEK